MKSRKIKIPRFRLLAGLLLAGVLMLAMAIPALAAVHPIVVYGDVELDDDPAPVGTNININLNGDPVATTEVTVAGEYGPVQVWADEARHGDIFSFTVDGNVATSDPAAPEFGWLNQEVDLTAYAGPPPTFYTLDVDIIPVGPPDCSVRRCGTG